MVLTRKTDFISDALIKIPFTARTRSVPSGGCHPAVMRLATPKCGDCPIIALRSFCRVVAGLAHRALHDRARREGRDAIQPGPARPVADGFRGKRAPHGRATAPTGRKSGRAECRDRVYYYV